MLLEAAVTDVMDQIRDPVATQTVEAVAGIVQAARRAALDQIMSQAQRRAPKAPRCGTVRLLHRHVLGAGSIDKLKSCDPTELIEDCGTPELKTEERRLFNRAVAAPPGSGKPIDILNLVFALGGDEPNALPTNDPHRVLAQAYLDDRDFLTGLVLKDWVKATSGGSPNSDDRTAPGFQLTRPHDDQHLRAGGASDHLDAKRASPP